MILLIPSYEPGDSLVTLVRRFRDAFPEWHVLVVDDGSGPDYAPVFASVVAVGGEVLHHGRNRGKGAALKTGFRHAIATRPHEAVVCADGDGQHLPRDIVRVADRIGVVPGAMVLGGRRFSGRVPLRSRLGNAASRLLFRFATGVGVHDTQTGLRGYPPALLPWMLDVQGLRFEYELRALVRAGRDGVAIDELPIDTVYLDGNASSHFRPVRDSVLVLAPLLAFGAASFASFLVDAGMLQLMYSLTGVLALSVVVARVVSALVNFSLNRRLIFRAQGRSMRRQLVSYAALALALLGGSYLGLLLLTGVGVPLLVAKALTDTTLYLASYVVQRRFVFRRKARRSPPQDVAYGSALTASRAAR